MMQRIKVAFLGDSGSGKTSLAKKLCDPDFVVNALYEETAIINYLEVKQEESILDLVDCSGRENLKVLQSLCLEKSKIGLLCINLTETINSKSIQEKINGFLKISPEAEIILVGTHLDNACEEQIQLFDNCNYSLISSSRVRGRIENQGGLGRLANPCGNRDNELAFCDDKLAVKKYVCSSVTGVGIEELRGILFSFVTKKPKQKITIEKLIDDDSFDKASRLLSDNSSLYQKIRVLKRASKTLSKEKQEEIGRATLELIQKLKDEKMIDKTPAIEAFETHCYDTLDGPHATLKRVAKIVAIVVITVVVTVVAAMIGFGIGVAAGFWTGPGAFFAGIMAGGTAAVGVVVGSSFVGFETGLLGLLGLFRVTPMSTAIQEVAESAFQKKT